VVAKTLEQFSVSPAHHLDAILAADGESRVVARRVMESYAS
jgi:hypothetical protein